jgi:hypothetical protein
MTILHIEHKIQNFDEWKKVFDSDPVNRRQSGVKHYRIYRPVDDMNYVIIELEFNHFDDAKRTLEALRKLWGEIEGAVITSPKASILDVVASVKL